MPEPDYRASPFPLTRWTLVLDAQEEDPEALAALCRDYWFPLYCFARRLRGNEEDAEDLTQGFFERLLNKGTLGHARSERGKLRTFLLKSFQNFAVDEHRRDHSRKRGGGVEHVHIDQLEVAQRLALEPRDELTPELEFDRAWARQLMAQVLERLRDAYKGAGKGDEFDSLSGQLVAGGDHRPYVEIAERLKVSEASVRVRAFKLRARYREMLKGAIAETVAEPDEIEDELQHLRDVFGN
ncbi:sigma-70 family RNA polymerase sigma factor [Verrucomicrobiaceae bacterium 227]